MQSLSNYKELLQIDNDIQIQMKSPAFELFNREKIKRFYNLNKLRLNILKTKLAAMMTEHIRTDDTTGEFMKINVGDGVEHWLFKTDADKEEYEAKWIALMSHGVEIHI